MWRYIGPCTTLFYTWTFKPHDATCDLKILNMRYIGPCANFFKNLMTLHATSKTSRCATYDLKNQIWTFWKHFFQQLSRATDRAGPPFGGARLARPWIYIGISQYIKGGGRNSLICHIKKKFPRNVYRHACMFFNSIKKLEKAVESNWFQYWKNLPLETKRYENVFKGCHRLCKGVTYSSLLIVSVSMPTIDSTIF